jgi:hypothetical protein
MLTPEQAKAMLPYIQAIAEGKTVQVKWFDRDFIDYTEYSPGYPDKDAEWRIKPDPVTIKYCVVLLGVEDAPYWVDTVQTEATESSAEKSAYFQRWLTDWIEVEV